MSTPREGFGFLTWCVLLAGMLSLAGQRSRAQDPVRSPNPLARARTSSAIPSNGASSDRPACPTGWAEFNSPVTGFQAHVPSGYWARLKGGAMFSVEKQDSPGTSAYMIPFRTANPGITAEQLAGHLIQFCSACDPNFRGRAVGQGAVDRAIVEYTTIVAGEPIEGRFNVIRAAGGSMAFAIGITAPRGKLTAMAESLTEIARHIAFTNPRGRWQEFRSPAGGFTLNLPAGWTVESSDGRNPKDNIDFVAHDPKRPLSRAFQWAPRFCTPDLAQHPMYQLQGYQVGVFQSPQQAAATSMGQICQGIQLRKVAPNAQLTQLFRSLNQNLAQLLAGMGAARMDVTVYDCLADARIDGKPVIVAFVLGMQTTVIGGGVMGNSVDTVITCRGWCAPPDQFINDSPMLERVSASFQLTPAFINRVVKGNEQAAAKIRETYDYMNKADAQIRQSRWDTQDAIAEMYHDLWTDNGGYVNEKTGRIEQMDSEHVVKNSSGELVSREEVRNGTPPDQATVLRDAYSNDYMRGVYGRIQFFD